MTVIAAALTKRDGIVIAGDSEITADFNKDVDGFCKLWIDDEHNFVFGGAGNIRQLQVIKYWTEWPYYIPGTSLEEFGVKSVVPEVRNALSEHGSLVVSKKTETFEGAFLMAWESNLLVVDEDFSVFSPSSNRYAIGSGQSEALGHLGNEGPWTKQEVINAVKKASITAHGVGGPLWVASTKSLTIEEI
jgi:hypothetical protein